MKALSSVSLALPAIAVCFSRTRSIDANRVHAFFYIWYGTPDFDGKFLHWDHEVLPHWEARINERFPEVGSRHSPPENLHSPFYPLQNPYSSKDRKTLANQFSNMKDAAISVAVVSWWGRASNSASSDTQGVATDRIMHEIFNAADEDGTIKLAFHLEPYHSRTVESVHEDLQYIIENYGNYSSLYRAADGRPLFYVYDSYHIFPSQWTRLLTRDGDISIRGTEWDGVFIGLWLQQYHGRDLKEGGFDGAYTYFASDGFSFGSTSQNWKQMCAYCRKNDMLSVLSVGPGYNDTSIRPWNAHNTRDRRDGDYYTQMWKAAIAAKPSVVSITSFNEWGEGTQIEPSRRVHPREKFPKTYLDYGEKGPHKYLHLTAEYAEEYFNSIAKASSSSRSNERADRDDENKIINDDEEVLQRIEL